MKVLLDENLPHKLRTALRGHEIVTVGYLGWNGLKNGELLKAAEQSDIDVLVTADRGLSYEQDLRDSRIAIVLLTAQKWPSLKWHLRAIEIAIDRSGLGSFTTVDCRVGAE